MPNTVHGIKLLKYLSCTQTHSAQSKQKKELLHFTIVWQIPNSVRTTQRLEYTCGDKEVKFIVYNDPIRECKIAKSNQKKINHTFIIYQMV